MYAVANDAQRARKQVEPAINSGRDATPDIPNATPNREYLGVHHAMGAILPFGDGIET